MNIIVLKIYDDVLPSIMEGCIQGFEGLGHKTEVVDLSGSEDPRDLLNREISKDLPDLLFTINHIGLTQPILELLSRLKLPYASWWVDNPLILTTKDTFKSPYLTLFVLDRFYIERLKSYGFDRVFYLPLATNPEIFREIELTEEEREEFGCTLSFVGGAFYKGFQTYEEYQKRDDLLLKELIDRILRLYLSNPSLELMDILTNVKEDIRYNLSDREERELVVSLELMAMSLHRKEIIEWLKGFDLHLYGDDGWKKMLGDGVRFRGRIDYKALPKLYNASQINLNITKSQLKTAVNQRVFDVAACGAFVLSDFRHDLGRLFEIEKEITFYRDRNDLMEKIEYFLSHPREREGMARCARERVLAEHTYINRMCQLVEAVGGFS